ncbi:MAG: prolyl oligopeptidase family serine peptidase [Flavobacteriales bacterium]
MLKSSLIIIILFLSYFCFSQDGTILEEEIYSLTDSMINSRIEYYPSLRENCRTVTCKRIIYQSDSIPVKGYLVQPKDTGFYPCIIFNRGGHGEFGEMTDAFTARLIEYSAMGFVVIATQYRGGCKGCKGKDEAGGKDINDVMNLFKVIDRLPNVDTSRIVMIGASRGGINTCQAVIKTNRIKLALLMYSPANLYTNVSKRPEMENIVLPHFIKDYWENRDSILIERSPVFWTEKFSKGTSIVIMHGTDDKKAFYEEAEELHNKLKKDGINSILETFQNGNHGLHTHWEEYWEMSKYYLELVKEKKAITRYKRH